MNIQGGPPGGVKPRLSSNDTALHRASVPEKATAALRAAAGILALPVICVCLLAMGVAWELDARLAGRGAP